MKNIWKGIAIAAIYSSCAYIGGAEGLVLGIFSVLPVCIICIPETANYHKDNR